MAVDRQREKENDDVGKLEIEKRNPGAIEKDIARPRGQQN